MKAKSLWVIFLIYNYILIQYNNIGSSSMGNCFCRRCMTRTLLPPTKICRSLRRSQTWKIHSILILMNFWSCLGAKDTRFGCVAFGCFASRQNGMRRTNLTGKSTLCFECGRFPCSEVRSLGKRYQENYDVDLIQNGLDARADMEAFLKSQRERFICKECGGIIDQHRQKCSDCGHGI